MRVLLLVLQSVVYVSTIIMLILIIRDEIKQFKEKRYAKKSESEQREREIEFQEEWSGWE